MNLSEDEIVDLIAERRPTRIKPLLAETEELLETAYRGIVKEACAKFRVEEQSEWNSYGSGYASFVDAWFYLRDGRASLQAFTKGEERHSGIFVLLSRLTRFYAVGEGEKSWGGGGGASYLPDLERIDSVKHPELLPLEKQLDEFLAGYSLQRLRKSQLSVPIPPHHQIETNMSNGDLKVFDAIFHWYD